MAQSTMNLSRERRIAGYHLLQKLDQVGLEPNAAGWVWEEADDLWWYFVATPLVDSQGPKWVWDRLLAALKIVHLPEGIKPLDIRLTSPREAVFRSIPIRSADLAQNEAEPQLHMFADLTLNEWPVSLLALYRIRDMNNQSGDLARKFDFKVRHLA